MRLLLLCLLAPLLIGGCAERPEFDLAGEWIAWLDSPGGRLEFALSISREGDGYVSEISGGGETLRPPTEFIGGELEMGFPHFDSTIRAHHDEASGRLVGEWLKYSGPEKWSSLAFHAVHRVHDEAGRGGRRSGRDSSADSREGPSDQELSGESPSVEGRWAVAFESSKDLAVAIFERADSERFPWRGTFLTTTGDYRYLWGELSDEGTLQLQAFDGAHAFLFKAQLQADGTLLGDFWSRDTWHESWSALRDEEIELPDAFALTRLEESIPLGALRFPDLDGNPRALDDPDFAGTARIIEIFGTWCPNCYDATQYLKELHARYGEQGLSILGLAFELSGDPERDHAQVKRYVASEQIPYPILVAGTNNKDAASAAFPLIDRVRSYPTFLFVDAEGEVRAIYTGFSGPASGAAHQTLRRSFEQIIEDMMKRGAGE